MGYPLKSCPAHGVCIPCPMDTDYMRLNTCVSEGEKIYTISDDKMRCNASCVPTTCQSYYTLTSKSDPNRIYDSCTSLEANCAETTKYLATDDCVDGYYLKNDQCVEGCAEEMCIGYNLSHILNAHPKMLIAQTERKNIELMSATRDIHCLQTEILASRLVLSGLATHLNIL